MIKLTRLLLEVSLDQLKTQYVDTGKITDSEFTEIVDSAGGKTAYATWLTKKVADKIIKPEDLYKYNAYFKIFDRRKREYQHADINQYKTLQDVSQFISKSVELADKEKADPAQQKGVAKNDKYQEFYIGSVDGFDVYELPKGRTDLYATSCELGSGTEWCTATGKTDQHFKHYISNGPLFIFLKPGSNEKYQFSYETDSFMDKNDKAIVNWDGSLRPRSKAMAFFDFIESKRSKYKPPPNIVWNLALKNDVAAAENFPTYIDGNLYLNNMPIKTLGRLETVNGNLALNNLDLKTLGNLKRVEGQLTIMALPGITSLENLEYVGGRFGLSGPIDSLGNLKYVGGDFAIGNNVPLLKKYSVEQIKQMVDIKGNIS